MRAGVKTPATITSCHSDEAWDGGENGPTRETCRFGAPALFPPTRPVGRSPPFSLGLAFGCAPEAETDYSGGQKGSYRAPLRLRLAVGAICALPRAVAVPFLPAPMGYGGYGGTEK